MTRTNSIAKVAAIVAMLGLVVMSFASFAAPAKAATTFTMDMTVGSTGAEVTALQTWLIAGGYSIPAGATGYFGAQTQAALAAYQAANGISPAAGYFGPITRAKVNAAGGTSTGGSTGGSSTGGLSGGEASLEDFQLDSEESSGDEGESEVEIATAKFDVEDADAEVERIEVDFQADNTGSESIKPWDYFDNVSIWADGEKIADMDVDARSDWDENNDDSHHSASTHDFYRLTFTGLDYVVEEGDQAEITIAADIAGTIDSSDLTQEFVVSIMDEGVRATDGEGIQQYTGDESDTVSFGFGAEQTGDLQIKTNSDDPDEATLISDDNDESDEYTVFMFDLDNKEDVDTLLTDLTIDVATSSGDAINSLLDSATLSFDGEEEDGDINNDGTITFEDLDYEIAGDDRVEFTLMVTLKEDADDATVQFSIADTGVEAEGVDSGDDADVSGSATGAEHTIALTGIMVDGVTKDSDVNDDNTTGTFELVFTVEALEDDVYIYNGAADSFSASTTGVRYNIYQGGTLLSATTTDSALLQSNADKTGNYWIVEEGSSEEFTLTVTLSPDGTTTSALYYVELEAIKFDDETTAGTVNDTTYTVPDRSEFETTAESLI